MNRQPTLTTHPHQKLSKIIKVIIITAFLSLLLAASNPATFSVKAQTNNTSRISLSVSPPVNYLSAQPDQQLTNTITLRNTGSKPLRVRAELTDFKTDGKSGQAIIQRGVAPLPAVTAKPALGQMFTLNPGQIQNITVNIDAAQLSLEKEYHWTVLFYAKTTGSITDPDSTTTQVSGVVGSNIILFVSSSVENRGKLIISEIDAPKIIDSFFPIQFSILAKNEGLTATPIMGRAKINNFLKQTIHEFAFYPDQVLAGSTRQVRGASFSPDLLNNDRELDPAKVEEMSTKFKYKPIFLLGPYQIKIQVGEHQQSIKVIALPISFLLAGVISGLMIFSYQMLKKEWLA